MSLETARDAMLSAAEACSKQIAVLAISASHADMRGLADALASVRETLRVARSGATIGAINGERMLMNVRAKRRGDASAS